MPMTQSDFSAILKTHYKGPISDLLNNTSAFLSRMERYSEPTGGNFCYLPLRTGRTSSLGARTDSSNEMLPVGDKPTYTQATFAVKSLYCTIRITGKVIRASRSENFAFARAQVRNIEDSTKDFKKDLNRQIFGDGSGELCRTTAVEISGANLLYTVASNLYPTHPNKFLHAGMIIDIRAISNGALHGTGDSRTIVAKVGTSQFTVVGTTSTAVTNFMVCREDNVDTNVIKEMDGLYDAIDDSNPSAIWSPPRMTPNFGGINRVGNPAWQSVVLHNSGVLRPFSLNLIEQGMDEVDIASGGEISLIQTNHAIFRLYGMMLAVAKTVDMAKMTLDGGFKALSVNGIPMVRDTECPDYTIFLIDESTFMLGVTGDYEWVEEGGSVLSRLAGQDQYEGVLVRDMQLLCEAPNKNGKIEDVSHS